MEEVQLSMEDIRKSIFSIKNGIQKGKGLEPPRIKLDECPPTPLDPFVVSRFFNLSKADTYAWSQRCRLTKGSTLF